MRSIQVETQGDSGEKVRIWGDDNISHCETKKKVYMKMCVVFPGFSSHVSYLNGEIREPSLSSSSGHATRRTFYEFSRGENFKLPVFV
jgi:hypothetical protein